MKETMNSVKISCVIITFNEEKKIARCLDSILAVSDEIIVVDSFSTDKTKEICEKYDLKFFENKFEGHIQQKNYALTLASNDIVLSLDADECLSDELRANIQKTKNNWDAKGYYFNRLTMYVDHWVKYCGWYPDQKLRLFDRQAASWGGHNPHDIIIMKDNSRTPHLKGDLLHYSYDSVSDHVSQTNKFTSLAARAAFESQTTSNLFKILTRPVLKFLRDYFYKLGFMDGRYGLIICSINALSAFLKYVKIYELQNNKRP
jgi:glycosyltransferase involved in cell wall biosynthesis